jgi:hypothetical protein
MSHLRDHQTSLYNYSLSTVRISMKCEGENFTQSKKTMFFIEKRVAASGIFKCRAVRTELVSRETGF